MTVVSLQPVSACHGTSGSSITSLSAIVHFFLRFLYLCGHLHPKLLYELIGAARAPSHLFPVALLSYKPRHVPERKSDFHRVPKLNEKWRVAKCSYRDRETSLCERPHVWCGHLFMIPANDKTAGKAARINDPLGTKNFFMSHPAFCTSLISIFIGLDNELVIKNL